MVQYHFLPVDIQIGMPTHTQEISMKNIYVFWLLTLGLSLACNDDESVSNGETPEQPSAEQDAKGAKQPSAEQDAKAFCSCIDNTISFMPEGPEKVKKLLEKCNSQLKDLREKYKGKENADEETVQKIVGECEQDFKLKMLKALDEQKEKARKRLEKSQ